MRFAGDALAHNLTIKHVLIGRWRNWVGFVILAGCLVLGVGLGMVSYEGLAQSVTTTAKGFGLEMSSAPKAFQRCNDPNQFNIQVRFLDRSLSSGQQAIVRRATQRWQQAIVGDLPDIASPPPPGASCAGFPLVFAPQPIDDILIDVLAVTFAPGQPRQLAAFSDSCLQRPGPRGLPYYGYVALDRTKIKQLEETGWLYGLMLHEIGHALGFNRRVFQQRPDVVAGLIPNEAALKQPYNPRFVGKNAVKAYRAAGGRTAFVPLENEGAIVQRDGHWRQQSMQPATEVMLTSGNLATPVLSAITLGAMADLGYRVNLQAADPYRL